MKDKSWKKNFDYTKDTQHFFKSINSYKKKSENYKKIFADEFRKLEC